MTRNTLSYLNLQETKRANLEKERQGMLDLQRKQDELAETMANNMRNFGINISKNAITKLANDQLNEREANKILATIQNNLASQSLKLREQIENERNNKEKNSLQRDANTLQELKINLDAAKASGKDAPAILLSWLTNQANLQAFTGENTFGKLTHQFQTWLLEGDNGTSNFSSNSTGRGSQANAVSNHYGYDPLAKIRMKNAMDSGDYNEYKRWYQEDRARTKSSRDRDQSYKWVDDKNEVPEDYSNSSGPSKGGKSNENVGRENEKDYQSGPGSAQSGSRSSNNSDQSTTKSDIIYSPRGRSSSSGPGIGLAFS